MKRIFYILLFFYLISELFVSCFDDLNGSPGASGNIQDSRSKGVFIAAYTADNDVIKINDSIFFHIKEVWVEIKWNFGKYGVGKISLNTDSTFGGGYQLVITTKEKIPEAYGHYWYIGDGFDRYLRSCGDHCFISDFKVLPGETESWKVYKGVFSDDKRKEDILGEVTLRIGK